jgi:hypothetical protein
MSMDRSSIILTRFSRFPCSLTPLQFSVPHRSFFPYSSLVVVGSTWCSRKVTGSFCGGALVSSLHCFGSSPDICGGFMRIRAFTSRDRYVADRGGSSSPSCPVPLQRNMGCDLIHSGRPSQTGGSRCLPGLLHVVRFWSRAFSDAPSVLFCPLELLSSSLRFLWILVQNGSLGVIGGMTSFCFRNRWTRILFLCWSWFLKATCWWCERICVYVCFLRVSCAVVASCMWLAGRACIIPGQRRLLSRQARLRSLLVSVNFCCLAV